MAYQELQGKTALITGASQGLGRVIALALAKSGCKVAINCAFSPGKAETVATEIRALGGQAQVVIADVSDENAVRTMFDMLREVNGGVDILVNNARIDPFTRSPETSEGDWWDRVMAVNLKGTYLCAYYFMQQAIPRKWGRMVNVSSVRAFIPAEPSTVAYGVSKLGMHGITRAFAEQGAPYGITANSVAPGMILTENLTKRLNAAMLERESGRIPLGRGATMEEIADAVLFAAGNGYVTGETININGGMYYAP